MPNEPIHKLPTGRWEVRYRDPSGRPRRERVDTMKQAKDHLAKVRTQGVEGSYIAPERVGLTFGSWCDEWWATKVDLRARTLRTLCMSETSASTSVLASTGDPWPRSPRPRFRRGSPRCAQAVSLTRPCGVGSRCSAP